MGEESNDPYLFGDLLALARQAWLKEMASRLDRLGYRDFRRSDTATMQFLRRGPVPIGQLGLVLGVTRQAARKVVDALEQRNCATTERDDRDARQLNVVVTTVGSGYARAIADVIDALNRELSQMVEPADLAAADVVLRAGIRDDATRERAARLVPPPAGHHSTAATSACSVVPACGA